MQHADRERELQISLATALRELDEARTDAANLRFVNDKARESLAAANARADTATAERDAARALLSGMTQASLGNEKSLAAARREVERLKGALALAAENLCLVGPDHDKPGSPSCGDEMCVGCVARAALAGPAPAPGEETKR